MEDVRLRQERDGPGYQAPALAYWLEHGIRTKHAYYAGCSVFTKHVAGLPTEEQSDYFALHGIYRLASHAVGMKRNLAMERSKRNYIARLERDKGQEVAKAFFRELFVNRIQRLHGEVPDVLHENDLEFMVERPIIERAGQQCLPHYIVEGFLGWEEGLLPHLVRMEGVPDEVAEPVHLTHTEYVEVLNHTSRCMTCTKEILSARRALAGVSVSGGDREEVLSVIRSAVRREVRGQ